MMLRLGFAEQWVKLIMRCVCSVSYVILLNGSPLEVFYPSRGLRQRDPLSPYLFLMCAEGLSSLLSRASQDGQILGVPISARGVKLSHLFFADDSLLFCRVNFNEWGAVLNILQRYELASGQKLNSEKTSIYYSRNTRRAFKEFIQDSTGIHVSASYEKYLGLPAMVGRSKTRIFAGIVSRVRKKLEDWKDKFLSQVGREILLKVVVQAIPAYCMSVFQLPKSLCSQIHSLMNRFWWGSNPNAKGVHWMNWSRLGLSKQRGGLGFRDLEAFNLALLAKQGWRLLQQPHSLLAQVLKGKYFPKDSFLHAKIRVNPSFTWRSLINAKSLLEKGLM
jgi:hypothetical protein